MICVISKERINEGGRLLQKSTGLSTNPNPEVFAIVPEHLIESIFETRGFCDIELNDEGSTVVSFTANEIPEIEEPLVSEEVSTEAVLNTLLGVD